MNASYIPRLWYLVPETSDSGIRCQEEGSKPWGIVLLGACIDAGPQPGAGELRPGEAVVAAGRPIAERVGRMGQQFTVGKRRYAPLWILRLMAEPPLLAALLLAALAVVTTVLVSCRDAGAYESVLASGPYFY